MDELTKMSADKDTRREYEARVREMNRIYAAKRTSFKKGEAKGIKKAKRKEGLKAKIEIEKGKKIAVEEELAKAYKEKLETAKKFLAMGISIERVVLGTDLSIEEVRSLI